MICTKRSFHDAARLPLLICLLALFQWSAATSGDHGSAEPHASPAIGAAPLVPAPTVVAAPLQPVGPRTVDEYLAAFDAAYRPPAFEQESFYAAEAAFRASQHARLARVTLTEALAWNDYSELDLEFGLDLTVPLHSSLTALQSELAAIDLESQRLAIEVARADANATLLLELANLAALGWARTLVSEALVIFDQQALGWHSGARGHSGYIPPEEREAFDHYLKLRDAEVYFSEQFEAGQQSLARRLELPSDGLFILPLSAVERFLAIVATPLPETPACLATSLHAEQVSLRSTAGTLDDELRSRSEFTIALTADLGYAFPSLITSGPPLNSEGASTTAGLNAALALEARILVPDGWPVAGSTAMVVSPERTAQSVELSWPPLPRPQVVVSDRAQDRANELKDLEAELLAMRNAWSQAESDRELLERRLRWALLDAAPELSAQEVNARLDEAIEQPNLYLVEPPAGGAARNPDADLTSVEIRVQHAFARVAEVSARARYLAACGRL